MRREKVVRVPGCLQRTFPRRSWAPAWRRGLLVPRYTVMVVGAGDLARELCGVLAGSQVCAGCRTVGASDDIYRLIVRRRPDWAFFCAEARLAETRRVAWEVAAASTVSPTTRLVWVHRRGGAFVARAVGPLRAEDAAVLAALCGPLLDPHAV